MDPATAAVVASAVGSPKEVGWPGVALVGIVGVTVLGVGFIAYQINRQVGETIVHLTDNAPIVGKNSGGILGILGI